MRVVRHGESGNHERLRTHAESETCVCSIVGTDSVAIAALLARKDLQMLICILLNYVLSIVQL